MSHYYTQCSEFMVRLPANQFLLEEATAAARRREIKWFATRQQAAQTNTFSKKVLLLFSVAFRADEILLRITCWAKDFPEEEWG